MARYIEVEAEIAYLKRVYCEKCNDGNGTKCNYCGIADALMVLEEADEADVVEVVHCKDCKEFHRADGKLVQHCKIYGAMVQEDDYCSCGKRKEK